MSECVLIFFVLFWFETAAIDEVNVSSGNFTFTYNSKYIYFLQSQQPKGLDLPSDEGRHIEPELTPLSFSAFMCEVQFEIHHELSYEGKNRDQTHIHLQGNLMMYVKFPSHIRPTWKLQSILPLWEAACTQQCLQAGR